MRLLAENWLVNVLQVIDSQFSGVITGCKVTIFRRRGCKGTTFDS
jgi:hypothetical protein